MSDDYVDLYFDEDELEGDGLPSKELLLDELATHVLIVADLEEELMTYRYKERLRSYGGLGEYVGRGVFN